jgi:hypothetical protein
MPDPDSAGFYVAYNAAFGGRAGVGRKATKSEEDRQRAALVAASIRRGIIRAKDAASKKKIEFDLTAEWAIGRAREQGYRCAITGIDFFDNHNSPARRHPYAPSIDRIKAGEGYTQDNCRIVCHAANVMLFDWGESVMRKAAAGFLSMP